MVNQETKIRNQKTRTGIMELMLTVLTRALKYESCSNKLVHLIRVTQAVLFNRVGFPRKEKQQDTSNVVANRVICIGMKRNFNRMSSSLV